MSFHQPSVWFLLLLLPLPVIVAWGWRRRARPAVGFSTVLLARAAGRSGWARWRWILPALRFTALALLVVALARPRLADSRTRVVGEGIAIQLVVDRSGSMEARDFTLDGRGVMRLDAVKSVVHDFVAGSGSLPGRPDDLVGLVTFASFADSLCPLTLDHEHVIAAIEQTHVAGQREGAGTAIGDALALGVERLTHLEERVDRADRQRVRSRVVILLTDGENNQGDLDPVTAAEMAAAFGIKVYTIGVGTPGGMIEITDYILGQPVVRRLPVRIDEETLREIAALTGGAYFRAIDTDSLKEIYARIDALETTRIEQDRYTRYTELAIEPAPAGRVAAPPLVTAAFVLLCLEFLLAHTRFRHLP